MGFNCVPYHLPNLDLIIITSTWIPPLDYSCQVCQKIDDANQMLLCDNCNGGYHTHMQHVGCHACGAQRVRKCFEIFVWEERHNIGNTQGFRTSQGDATLMATLTR